jgi:hypothetical protein
MAWRTPISRSRASSAASSSVSSERAADRPVLTRRNTISGLGRAGGEGSAIGIVSAGRRSIASTEWMSAPRRWNTSAMPPCEAMPASCAFMLSNTGPSVSVRS